MHAYGPVMTTVTVRGCNHDRVEDADVSTFHMVDGRYRDTAGFDFAASDDSALRRDVLPLPLTAD